MFKLFKTLYRAWRYKQLHKLMDRQKQLLAEEAILLDAISDALDKIRLAEEKGVAIKELETALNLYNSRYEKMQEEMKGLEAVKVRLYKIVGT